jgi:hypothetical protein
MRMSWWWEGVPDTDFLKLLNFELDRVGMREGGGSPKVAPLQSEVDPLLCRSTRVATRGARFPSPMRLRHVKHLSF